MSSAEEITLREAAALCGFLSHRSIHRAAALGLVHLNATANGPRVRLIDLQTAPLLTGGRLARLANCSIRTVRRRRDAGDLHPYCPAGADGAHRPRYSLADVARLRDLLGRQQLRPAQAPDSGAAGQSRPEKASEVQFRCGTCGGGAWRITYSRPSRVVCPHCLPPGYTGPPWPRTVTARRTGGRRGGTVAIHFSDALRLSVGETFRVSVEPYGYSVKRVESAPPAPARPAAPATEPA